MKKTILMIVLVCWAVAMVRAQKTCVIANAEDHVPVREALIHTDNNHWARTDYRGYWTMKYQFDSATVSKPGFLKTTIYLKNLPDTVFLLPQSHQLREVEVWGENMPGIKGIQNDAHRQAEIGGANAPSGASFDLAKMLDKRGRRDSKHLREAQKIFGEMDRKDPILGYLPTVLPTRVPFLTIFHHLQEAAPSLVPCFFLYLAPCRDSFPAHCLAHFFLLQL